MNVSSGTGLPGQSWTKGRKTAAEAAADGPRDGIGNIPVPTPIPLMLYCIIATQLIISVGAVSHFRPTRATLGLYANACITCSCCMSVCVYCVSDTVQNGWLH